VDAKHPEGGGGNPGSQSLGGFLGFSLIGAGVARLSQPLGLAFAVVGAARTTYANVLGKGHEVLFAADTPIELQLAPGPSTFAGSVFMWRSSTTGARRTEDY
jgi:hypothetical protein